MLHVYLPIPTEQAQVEQELSFLENVWVPWCRLQLDTANQRVDQLKACSEKLATAAGQRRNGVK